MPVKVLEKQTFTYIAYHNGGANDLAAFRRALVTALKKGPRNHEIVIDLTSNASLPPEEKTLLTNGIAALTGSNRRLHLIVSTAFRPVVEEFSCGNCVVYDSHQELLDAMNRSMEGTA